MSYQVRAIREKNWWAIEFDAVDGRIHSQARRLEQVPAMAAEAIEFWFDDGREVTADEIDVEIVLPVDLAAHVEEAKQLRSQMERLSTEVARRMRETAVELHDVGLPLRDVGALLEVSHQRAQQLVKSPTSATRS